MAETVEQKPIPHDGFSSRLFLFIVVAAGLVFVVTTAAWLWLGKMTTDQWVACIQWLLPWAFGIYAIGNVGQKFAGVKAVMR